MGKAVQVNQEIAPFLYGGHGSNAGFDTHNFFIGVCLRSGPAGKLASYHSAFSHARLNASFRVIQTPRIIMPHTQIH